MSAGTGLTHSEFNRADKPVHFYQIWIYPDTRGLKPTYDQKKFFRGAWKNRLLPVASGQGFENAVTFHTDATIYRAALDAHQKIAFKAKDTRRMYVYVTAGELEINGTMLSSNDQGRIDLEEELMLKARKETDLILIDVPSCKGYGYDEKTLKGGRQK
jgi:redox-sensitive bicupin YhaK (pirin superfamily)